MLRLEMTIPVRGGTPRVTPAGTGTGLVTGDGMFRFAPPPAPQTAPTPCPQCHGQEAIPLYATARTEYYRCVQCRHWWSVTHEDSGETHYADVA
jgi:hypothetical protein